MSDLKNLTDEALFEAFQAQIAKVQKELPDFPPVWHSVAFGWLLGIGKTPWEAEAISIKWMGRL